MNDRRNFLAAVSNVVQQGVRENKMSRPQAILTMAVVRLPRQRAAFEEMLYDAHCLSTKGELSPMPADFDWSSVDWLELLRLILTVIALFQ